MLRNISLSSDSAMAGLLSDPLTILVGLDFKILSTLTECPGSFIFVLLNQAPIR